MGAALHKESKIKPGSVKAKETPKIVREGDPVPNVNLKALLHIGPGNRTEDFEFAEITTRNLFAGKRVVVFGIPGAFTPVCTCDHLPSYVQNFHKFKRLGIDEVFCVSVNDGHVMRQWGKMNGLEEETLADESPLNPGNFKTIKLIADGAAKFTTAMGLAVKWELIGSFGLRSWRYSAVFNDMVIEKLFLEEDGKVEDDYAGGPEPFEVSGAQIMLQYLHAVKDEKSSDNKSSKQLPLRDAFQSKSTATLLISAN